MFLVFNLPLPLPKNLPILCFTKILSILFSICFPALLHNVHIVSLKEYSQNHHQLHYPHSPDGTVPLYRPLLVTPLLSVDAACSPRDQQPKFQVLNIFCLEKISYCEAICSIYETFSTSAAISFNSRNRFRELCM